MAFDIGSAGSSAASAAPLAGAGPLGWATLAANVIGGGLAGGAQADEARKQRQQQWNEFLQQMALQKQQLDSTNAVNATKTGYAQASLPLMDQAFSGLQSRFGLGPSTFGNAGAQNTALGQAAANYKPGQNPSVNNLGDVYAQTMKRFGIKPTGA